MSCKCDLKTASFGSELYCKTCGMDIGFEHITKRINKSELLFCCNGCADNNKKS